MVEEQHLACFIASPFFGGSIPNVQTLIEARSKPLINLDVNHIYNYLRSGEL